jgi:hypothetical protein
MGFEKRAEGAAAAAGGEALESTAGAGLLSWREHAESRRASPIQFARILAIR